MYRRLWSKLPGGKISKTLALFGLLALAVLFLFTVVFPWLDVSFFAPPTIGN